MLKIECCHLRSLEEWNRKNFIRLLEAPHTIHIVVPESESISHLIFLAGSCRTACLILQWSGCSSCDMLIFKSLLYNYILNLTTYFASESNQSAGESVWSRWHTWKYSPHCYGWPWTNPKWWSWWRECWRGMLCVFSCTNSIWFTSPLNSFLIIYYYYYFSRVGHLHKFCRWKHQFLPWVLSSPQFPFHLNLTLLLVNKIWYCCCLNS